MKPYEIFIRLLVASIFAAIIGLDRETKNRPAGISTHILVCVGATLIALIQTEIMNQVILISVQNPEVKGVIRSDPARLICQVVSGIGFLGAGTIIVTKRSVIGLTTSASLWSMAGIGLALGMGYYSIGIISSIFVFVALKIVKKIIHIPTTMQLQVSYLNSSEIKQTIVEFFGGYNIILKEMELKIDSTSNDSICTNTFLLDIPKNMECEQLVYELSHVDEIKKIALVHLN